MRIAFICLFINVFTYFTACAQMDSINRTINIDNSLNKSGFELKKRFYKNYREFLDNSPSIIREFTVVQKSSPREILESGVCAAHYKLGDNQEKVGSFWGFSDGNAVYFKFLLLDFKYWKLDCIGPYSFFVYQNQSRSIGSLIYSAAVPRSVYIINKKGKGHEATVNYLKKIFAKVPSLLEEYDNDPKKGNYLRKRDYLLRFNAMLQK